MGYLPRELQMILPATAQWMPAPTEAAALRAFCIWFDLSENTDSRKAI